MRVPRTVLAATMLLAILLTMLALPVPARAGGWAAVTLDDLPRAPRAGEVLSLGFMVRQHGVTPTDSVTPYLTATNRDTGESLRINARKEGPIGHFFVDVTFPSAGAWEWEIMPAPFPMATKLEPLMVLPPVATAPAPEAKGVAPVSAPAPAPATSAEPSAPAPASPAVQGIEQVALRWVAAALLLVAGGVALAWTLQGSAFGRRPLPRSR